MRPRWIMTKRVLVILLLILPLSLCAQRRSLRFGIMGGVDYTALKAEDAAGWKLRAKPGFQAGFSAGWYGRIFSVMPEFVYGRSSYVLKHSGVGKTTLKISTGDLAVMAGVHLGPACLEVGPTFCVLDNTSTTNVEATLFRPTVGYAVRAGIKFLPKLTFYVGHGGGFASSTLSIVGGPDNDDADLRVAAKRWNAGLRLLF